MAKRENSIQYDLLSKLLPAVTNDHTAKSYKRNTKDFASFCRSEGVRTPSDLQACKQEMLQKYANHLSEQGYSPATIHTALAGPCKALDVSMSLIDKPRRDSTAIEKGRAPSPRAEKELVDPRFKRSVELAWCTGVRRAELANLRGGLVRDESGHLCVRVISGKGGKDQLQRILPGLTKTVKKILSDPRGKGGRVLASSEIGSHINYHAIRRMRARQAYSFYENKIADPVSAEKLKAELIKRYAVAHPAGSEAKAKAWLESQLGDTDVYKLRGSNRSRAEASGRPTTYSRLALLAVSVFHLSHWRLDVTVTNYMI